MTDNRTTELLPCPFCGGEAETHETIDGWIAACSSEQSELDGFTHKAQAYGTTEAEAIAAWNARAEHGTLTADDIRGLIERHSDESGGNGRDFHNGAYVAIADELNARAERTCHIVKASRKYVMSDGTELFEDGCSECNTYICEGDNYCPNCGAKVIGGDV